MTAAIDNGSHPGLRLGSRARLILHVSLRRLGPHAQQIQKAIEGYSVENAAAFTDEIWRIPRGEGLAVLAAIPAEARLDAIAEFAPPGPDRAALQRVAAMLGDASDPGAPATVLLRMYPEAAELEGELEENRLPAPTDEKPLAPEAPELTVPALAATVAVWEDEAAALDALQRLTEPMLQYGSPLPASFWAKAAERLRTAAHPGRWLLLSGVADLLFRQGETQAAFQIWEELAAHFEENGEVRARGAARTRMADILVQQGSFDRARAFYEEAIRDFQTLEDAGGVAFTRGRIADVLQARGQLDEALRIRREEQLPVYERLGDARSRAVTLGKVADVLEVRGELDEALRIRREELLPVFERLGDVRSRAATLGQIADVLAMRGELDEALRILRAEELPVYERLGDVRSRAVILGKIADVLQARGELDEALRIRREEQLPVYEYLGDVRERAVALGQIAGVLEVRGELDEALRILREEVFPVFERLGEAYGSLVTKTNLAQDLWLRNRTGDREEARGLLSEALTAAERMRIPEAQQIRRIQEQWDREAPAEASTRPAPPA